MNNVNFSAFFSRVSDHLGINSQQELASLLNVSRSAVTQAKKRDIVPHKWLHKLSSDFGLRSQWLETGSGPVHFEPTAADSLTEHVDIPKVAARLCAGGGSFEVGGSIKEYHTFQLDWIRRKGSPQEMVLMDVFGNSMEPDIKEGDTVLIDQSQKAIVAGSFYAVGVEDTVMVKRIEKRPSSLVLLSENSDYSPIVLQGDELDQIRIIGKIVWSCREYR